MKGEEGSQAVVKAVRGWGNRLLVAATNPTDQCLRFGVAMPIVLGEKLIELSGPWQASLSDGKRVNMYPIRVIERRLTADRFCSTVCFANPFEIPAR